MRQFKETLAQTRPSKGELAVYWLGQAGFAFVTRDGKRIVVDPYLSDCCERYFGFIRILPHLLSADELKPDLLIATHAHYDHFDVDSVPTLLSDGAAMLCAKDCAAECERLHIDETRVRYLSAGDTAEALGVRVHALPCDHGALAPDALALLLEIDGKRVYIDGDTCFREDHFRDEAIRGADLAIVPINGAYGNMNEAEAARALAILQPKLGLPCHYWCFAVHRGDPQRFIDAMREEAPEIRYRTPPIGGCVLI